MARKIVFLDFDGPIATSHSYKRVDAGKIVSGGDPSRYIDNELVKRVEELCVKADAHIVLSTSWVLIQGKDWCVEMLESKGVSVGRVIGATPRRLSNHYRGNEINWWLRDNLDVSLSDCVILDDDKDFYPDQMPRFIETPFDIGLTEAQVELAVSMLRSPYIRE